MAAIHEATSDEALRRCFAVVLELRPQLVESEFAALVARQREAGYRLVYLEDEGDVQAVAGYRIMHMLARGRSMYVDDLVTRADQQGKGYGSRLFDWLVARARSEGCARLHLDSGVQRFGAHRFYLHKGLDITAHHFSMPLAGPAPTA